MSILTNTTRHKITSVFGVIVMTITSTLWVLDYTTDLLKKDFNWWQLGLGLLFGIALLFATDDFIKVIISGAKRVIRNKTK